MLSLPLYLAVGVTELDHVLVQLDAVLLRVGPAGLSRAPEVSGQLLPVVEPAEGPLGLQVTGAHPEGPVGEPGHEEALESGQLLSVGELYQMSWRESWSP